jgi:hypothetical protein
LARPWARAVPARRMCVTGVLLRGGWCGAYLLSARYLLSGCMGICLALQIWLLNRALVTFSAFGVVALYQVVWLVVCILSGVLVFGDGEEASTGQNVGFAVGCMMCVLGTLATRYVGDGADHHSQSGSAAGMSPQRLEQNGSLLGRDDLDDMLQLLDIDTTTRNWSLVELRQQLILEKATAVRLHAEIEEKDARITMMQIRLATFDSASSDSVATASNM